MLGLGKPWSPLPYNECLFLLDNRSEPGRAKNLVNADIGVGTMSFVPALNLFTHKFKINESQDWKGRKSA